MFQSPHSRGPLTHQYEHLINTKATEKTCHRCQAAILEAHDDGLRVQVDAQALDGQPGELAALLDGRDTYTRTIGSHLIHRTADRIRASWLKGDIHAEHRCDPAQIQEALF